MKVSTRPTSIGSNQRAFTLIELMIAVAIVAILAAIALPSYNSYIIKSEIRTAQSDLLALSLNFENKYQRTLEYPVLDASKTTGDLKDIFKGWSPSARNFDYSPPASTTTTYTLKATGTGRQAGCSLTIDYKNVRSSTGCKYITAGDWL